VETILTLVFIKRGKLKRTCFLLIVISFLIVSCAPVVEKQKKEKIPPPKPVEKIKTEPVEAVQVLRKGPARISKKPYKPGTFLLKTTWNQGFPYNKRLPKLNNERVVTGCVNTALAQVLYYYRFPRSSHGTLGYQWNRRQLTANLHKNYNWDIIPTRVTAETPIHQIDELAALFRDLGIVNGTKFNLAAVGGSGASFNTRALVEKFGYSNNIKILKSKHPAFLRTIKREIDSRRVVLLSISGKPSGHMTVIDGYRRDANGIKFHINMGWGGTDNDFYDLTRTIVPKSKKEKNSLASDYTFTRELTIYYNLTPCREADCYRNLEPEDVIRGMKIAGKFNGKKDKDVFEGLFLNGPTVFKGDRGYGNQAFYIKVYDNDNRLLVAEAPKSRSFRVDLEPGRYSVEVSLCKRKQKGETCYGDDSKHLTYKVGIKSKPVSAAVKNYILTRDTPPEITGRFPDMILKKSFRTHKIRIDALDPDGDLLTIRAFTDKDDSNVNLSLNGNILSISPKNPASNTTSAIMMQAVAKGEVASRSFRILFSATSVAFGKEFNVRGKFVNQESRNRHKVLLQGNCVIHGDNGFKTPGFYINVTDSEGRERYKTPLDMTLRDRFPRGAYYIESMLKYKKITKKGNSTQTSIRRYRYKKGIGDTYNINVSCPKFNDSLASLEKDNQDEAPRITSMLPNLILGVGFLPLEIPIETLDINGDWVTLSARSHTKGIKAVIKGHRLTLVPDAPRVGSRVKITVTAKANGQRSSKSFTVFLQKRGIAFGKQFQVKGKIIGQKDIQMHPVILSGQCRIIGNNGYSNQAFYTSVKRQNKSSVIQSVDKEIVHSFPRGVYYLTASLTNDQRRYYTYRRGKGDQYKISVTCANMNASTEDIARLLGH